MTYSLYNEKAEMVQKILGNSDISINKRREEGKVKAKIRGATGAPAYTQLPLIRSVVFCPLDRKIRRKI